MCRTNQSLVIYFLITLSGSFLLYSTFLNTPNIVTIIEHFQLLILSLGFLISLYFTLSKCHQKHFWLWTSIWWLILFGRSINWGRLYFPDYPRSFFHIIAAIIILGVIVPFLIPKARYEIITFIKKVGLPFKQLILLIMIYALIDQIDNSRSLFGWFRSYITIIDPLLLEESIEVFFITGLFSFMSFYQSDKIHLK